jgi:hypothetical protein
VRLAGFHVLLAEPMERRVVAARAPHDGAEGLAQPEAEFPALDRRQGGGQAAIVGDDAGRDDAQHGKLPAEARQKLVVPCAGRDHDTVGLDRAAAGFELNPAALVT